MAGGDGRRQHRENEGDVRFQGRNGADIASSLANLAVSCL